MTHRAASRLSPATSESSSPSSGPSTRHASCDDIAGGSPLFPGKGFTWATTPAAESGVVGSATLDSFVLNAAGISPMPDTCDAETAPPSSGPLSQSPATGRSMKWNDQQVNAPCAFVDWELTSSRTYTVLCDLLEARIRMLTK